MKKVLLFALLTATLAMAQDEFFDLQLVGYRHDFSRDWRKLNSFRGASLRETLSSPDAGQAAVYAAILRGEEDATSDDQILLIGTNGRVFVSEGLQLVSHFRPTWGNSTCFFCCQAHSF